MSKYFLVSVPNPDKINGSWKQITVQLSKEEAIEFVQMEFGADEEGKVCLVSEVDDNEEEVD